MATPTIQARPGPALYPVRVDGSLDAPSRWMWLVKWLLAVPHYVVLAFLWAAFVVLSVVAFVAILITGRYPRALFDFNVGVLRWSWRVSYYAYSALGTDRYPPFTLAEDVDYPAQLHVDYPEHLSRGLVLVKTWLLAVPHYVVIGFFVGGTTWAGTWAAGGTSDRQPSAWQTGLIGILVLVAAVVLTFTGRYPRSVFDFVLGMNRWVLRVAAYAALMTDRYPPFRLDLGAHEGGQDAALVLGAPADSPPAAPAAGASALATGAPAATAPGGPPAPGPSGSRPTARGSAWTAGTIIAVTAGALSVLIGLALLVGVGTVAWADHHRDGGYVTTPTRTLSSTGYAVTATEIELNDGGPSWVRPERLFGTVRLRVRSTDPATAVFVGVARTGDLDAYLQGVPHTVLPGPSRYDRRLVGGSAAPQPPGTSSIWVAKATGTGLQTLTWTPTSGSWSAVVMRADAGRGVFARADAGAVFPDLSWLLWTLGALAAFFLLLGIALVGTGVGLAVRRSPGTGDRTSTDTSTTTSTSTEERP